MRTKITAIIATLLLAVVMCPAAAFAAEAGSGDLQGGSATIGTQSKDLSQCSIKFTDKQHKGKTTDTWQMYYVKGKKTEATPKFDLYYNGKKVDSSKYKVTYKLTWWNEAKEKDMFKKAKKLTASASPEASSDNMASEYRIVVTAKKGSGFSGVYDQATIVVCDQNNIGFNTDLYLKKAKSAWHYAINGMNRNYYVIPQAKVKATLKSLKVLNGGTDDSKHDGKAVSKKEYKVTYYKAKRSLLNGVKKTGKALKSIPTTPGSYAMVVKGKGSHYGTKLLAFDVQGSMSKANVAAIGDQKYTGQPIAPALKVTYKGKALKQGVDYKVTFSNNTEPGTATAVIEGCNPIKTFEFDPSTGPAIVEKDADRFFTGSQTVTFKIVK